ncbi:DUF397 domain-containing protein [Actinokineospora diospyrosa]|uniref:DUF397 domain-containing protein n=1 Tax=Actinokineospora diospyrosa TaxID=103728 RepID=A0ABT1I8H9_9PSEU|nr:DUF397 domain-containing protein [Actinokineospora diospyrosa]MCP2268931.1 protein of unknown function (DUF397) [Actinokineospora diospyrosa]
MPNWSTVPFRKSSRSGTNGGSCVEVGFRPGLVAVRDSKCPAGGLLELPPGAWTEALASFRTP